VVGVDAEVVVEVAVADGAVDDNEHQFDESLVDVTRGSCSADDNYYLQKLPTPKVKMNSKENEYGPWNRRNVS